MNKLYVISYTVGGMFHSNPCPLCFYENYDRNKMLEHFQNNHSTPNDKWELQTFSIPGNLGYKLEAVVNFHI